jgi:hypothetical protein
MSAILWRRLDQPGHDSARLTENATGPIIEGTALFNHDGQPCRLDYHVLCDPEWRTVSARVTGWLGATPIAADVGVTASREWMLNGRHCPAVRGCDDVDLSFTPATNLLPIRRLRPASGVPVNVTAAWFSFPEMQIQPLEQTYERLGESKYRYTSQAGDFTAILETNAAGFVTYYPGLWRLEQGG